MVRNDSISRLDSVEPGSRVYPCSQSQLRFWVEEQLSPRNPALNVAVRWRLDGLVTHSVLEEAWRRLIARHEPLRTAFDEVDGEAVQIVRPHVAISIPVVDLRDLPEKSRAAEADRIASVEASTPFDIVAAPLIRVTRLIISDRSTMLLVTAHHMVCDGWSVGILAEEMGMLCAALEAGTAPLLPDLPLTFGEFAAWEREEAAHMLADERVQVRDMLSGSRQFELLPDFPRPRVFTSNGAISSVLIDRGLTDDLTTFARSTGCTLFMVSLAGIFATLARHTGETDIVLGTQVVGRDDEDLERLVGCFINTIALRGDVSGDPDFVTLLERTRDVVTHSFEHRRLPLQDLVEIAKPTRDPSRNALFSVNVIFQRSFITNRTYGSFDLIDLPSRSAGALYDVNLFMVERPEGWRVSCEYNIDLFGASTITGLLERFVNVLSSVCSDPHRQVSRLPLLTEADRQTLMLANSTQADYPADKTLPQLFAEQAARTPLAVAVRCGNKRLTYADLAVAVRRLAQRIIVAGCRPGDRIGIALDRSVEMLVAMLAVLDSGCAYVPLDPKYPAQRLDFIRTDSGLSATITRSAFAFGGASQSASEQYIFIDESGARNEIVAPRVPYRGPKPDDVAYVIYTSGSTGRPKGVQVGHRALVNFLWSMRERPGLTAGDTLVAVTTISFDIAALELYLPLVTGAQLVIASETDVVDGQALAALLARSNATIMQATPVTWQLLVDSGWRGSPGFSILCGGEALSRQLADELLARADRVWNMYGPTETTIWSAVGRVTAGEGPVLIGAPIANTQLYVLDDNGQLVPPGVAGELYIGGDGVALGYLGREELTRERFLPDPFSARPGARMYRTGDIVRTRNGAELEFFGRIDSQIKLRGFRIELDEVAGALLRQPGVLEAVAVAGDDASGYAAIHAYVVGSDRRRDREKWAAELRVQLGKLLPTYMLPAAIVVLDQLPRTPNGKIDRSALPAAVAGTRSAEVTAPAEGTESTIAQLAAELLGVTMIGRDTDLFALGMHSLLAARLAARIARSTGIRLPLRLIFDGPTVAAIAANIARAQAEVAAISVTAPQPVVAYNPAGRGVPFLFFHGDADGEGIYCRRLATAIGAERPVFCIAPHASAGLPALTRISDMARDHYDRVRALQPHGPYNLGGYCAGGLVAYELARLLRAAGEAVHNVIVVNAPTPARREVLFGDWLLRRVGLDERVDATFREAFCWNVVRLFDAIGAGPGATIDFLARRLRAAVDFIWRPSAAGFLSAERFAKEPVEGESFGYFVNLVAAYTYHPEAYEGEMTFIWGREQAIVSGGPTTGWDQLARRVRVVNVSGGHLSPVQEGVEELGRTIAAELAR